MTNPTLERAARALYEFGMMADCPTWDQLDQKYKEDFFDMARAVLMAVRAEMCDTVCIGVIDDILSGSTHERATEDSQQG